MIHVFTFPQSNLYFMALTSPEIAQFCVSVMVNCLRDRAFKNLNEDLAVGHLIVLLQYDWPNHAGVLEEILAKIQRQGPIFLPVIRFIRRPR